jgi:peroxiredoxin
VRKVTLSNSIRAFCKNHKKHIKPEEILHGLVERGVVVIDEHGRVSYAEAVAVLQTTPVTPVLDVAPPDAALPE